METKTKTKTKLERKLDAKYQQISKWRKALYVDNSITLTYYRLIHTSLIADYQAIYAQIREEERQALTQQ